MVPGLHLLVLRGAGARGEGGLVAWLSFALPWVGGRFGARDFMRLSERAEELEREKGGGREGGAGKV
jgi:hypothetical protein